MVLHITNGDSVIHGFREAALIGDYLSWADLLYEGPVSRANLDGLSPIRARFLVNAGWSGYDEALALFSARNQTLKSFPKYDEVVLWFEHDLTDQLQLIQILHWFRSQELNKTRLSLVCIDAFPGVTPFHGLGQLTGKQLAELFPHRTPVTEQQLSLAHDAWEAFCAPEPIALLNLITRDLSALSFLKDALRRFLEEYPSLSNGLSRTERQILFAAASGRQRRIDIYQASQEAEKARFMGDLSVWLRLDRLAAGPAPALERSAGDSYQISYEGRSVLEYKTDWVQSQGGIDVWLGGVRLQGETNLWRWDEKRRKLSRS
ncbi:MAG: DUF1835 domain-containing protein [Terriglobia bacterium]